MVEAVAATLQGFDVRYVEADTEFARHALSSSAEQAALLRSFVEPELVVLEDLFLARRISEADTALLQTVVHQRYKQRRSLLVTSNRVVQDWGKYLGDATTSLDAGACPRAVQAMNARPEDAHVRCRKAMQVRRQRCDQTPRLRVTAGEKCEQCRSTAN